MKFQKFKTAEWLEAWMEANKKTNVWLSEMLRVSERHAARFAHQRDLPESKIRMLSIATGKDLFVEMLSDESRALYERGKALADAERASLEGAGSPEAVLSLQEQVDVLRGEVRELRRMVEGGNERGV